MPATGLDNEVTTTEADDNSVNTWIILQRRSNFARGRVIVRKRDADRNPTGRANANPILDI